MAQTNPAFKKSIPRPPQKFDIQAPEPLGAEKERYLLMSQKTESMQQNTKQMTNTLKRKQSGDLLAFEDTINQRLIE